MLVTEHHNYGSMTHMDIANIHRYIEHRDIVKCDIKIFVLQIHKFFLFEAIKEQLGIMKRLLFNEDLPKYF